jgi:hypothetical protein
MCCWNHRVVPISNSCLDVQIMELDIFFSLNNIKLHTYINSRKVSHQEEDQIIYHLAAQAIMKIGIRKLARKCFYKFR